MSLLQRIPGSLTQKIDGILAFFFLVALVLIGYALFVGHQLEGGAGAINEAGLQRMRTYRIAYLLEQAANDPSRRPRLLIDVEQALDEYDEALRILSEGDPKRPLFLPAEGPVREQMARVRHIWSNEMAPRFRAMVEKLQTPFLEPQILRGSLTQIDEAVRRYVPEVHRLVSEIETWNAKQSYARNWCTE